jgi:hypothetical protein
VVEARSSSGWPLPNAGERALFLGANIPYGDRSDGDLASAVREQLGDSRFQNRPLRFAG